MAETLTNLTNGKRFIKIFPTNIFLLVFLQSICQNFARQSFHLLKIFPVKLLCYTVHYALGTQHVHITKS